MEMQLDMNGLDKPCTCEVGQQTGILAGNHCRKDETCPCGSGLKVCECCTKGKGPAAPEANAEAGAPAENETEPAA